MTDPAPATEEAAGRRPVASSAASSEAAARTDARGSTEASRTTRAEHSTDAAGPGRAESDDSAHAAAGAVTDPQPQARSLLVESLGGWRGLLDSGLPVVVFVAANAIGGLTAAIWAAIACGVLLFALRLARRQSVQQAISGFLGVALAAYIASRTGEAKGFFLLGIWASFGYGLVFLGSVLVRWPLVGLIWEYVEGSAGHWRRNAPLVRVYTWTTLVWVAIFLARGLVQRFLYDQDRTGWLAVARLAMGYPLTVGALGVTILAVRRVRRRAAGGDGGSPAGAEQPA